MFTTFLFQCLQVFFFFVVTFMEVRNDEATVSFYDGQRAVEKHEEALDI